MSVLPWACPTTSLSTGSGDTFRWRAENVSTNEVGEILNACAQIEISNVYGVEIAGAEGTRGDGRYHSSARSSARCLEALSGYIDPRSGALCPPDVSCVLNRNRKPLAPLSCLKGTCASRPIMWIRWSSRCTCASQMAKHYQLLGSGFLSADIERQARLLTLT